MRTGGLHIAAKCAAALALFAVAGAAAFYLKDAIDRANPDYAVPQITVTADSKPVATLTDAYSWSFYVGGDVIREETPVPDLSLTPVTMLGGETLDISFSQPALETKLTRTDSYTYTFKKTQDAAVPFESGVYIYNVFARFERGAVSYYFCIVVE
ncbi:MAG: hypothetical protein VB021_08955 [Oscillospiraceae bacterium]|nr:hypothetical protein [Oscillospiraceae bacterium]